MQGKRTYLTARIVLRIIEVCGWVLVVLGVVAMVAIPFILAERFRYVPFMVRTAVPELRGMPPILGAIPGIGMIVGGLLTVAVAQFASAIIDMSRATQSAFGFPKPPETIPIPAPEPEPVPAP